MPCEAARRNTKQEGAGVDGKQDKKLIDLIIRLLFLGLFVYSALVMVAPLASVVIWASILAVALYPLFDWLQQKLGGRTSIASTILVLIGLALTLGPVATGVSATIGAVTEFGEKAAAGQVKVPPAPEKLGEIPIVGPRLVEVWSLFERNLALAFETYGAQIKEFTLIIFGTFAGVATSLLGLALSAVIMGALLAPGPEIVKRLQAFANRVFAPRGSAYVTMAGATIRNVTKGVVGVAALQAFAIWIVLVLFGIQSAAVLAFICFFLSIVQLGPGIVFLPLIIYAWNSMSGGAALLFTILAVPLTIGDSFLRPVMISKGLSTPMIVIIIGVIGGVMAYGLIGIFMGPVLFAVFYELFKIWMEDASEDDANAGKAG